MFLNKIYGYARVSTKEQNLDRQIEALKEYGVHGRDIIKDKQSGKDFKRDGYITLKEQLLRPGDTLVIKELDRLGRNMDMIKEEWNSLIKMDIDIVVLDTPILNTTNKGDLEKSLISNIVFELLSYMAEKERIKIKKRQAEGIKLAKEKGKHLGRPKATYPTLWEMYYVQWKSGSITAKECMEQLELKRTTFYKLAKRYDEDINEDRNEKTFN